MILTESTMKYILTFILSFLSFLVCSQPMDGRTDKWQLYFSTDEMQDAKEVLDFYRTRFQLEFCFRAVSYTHLDVYKRQGICWPI